MYSWIRVSWIWSLLILLLLLIPSSSVFAVPFDEGQPLNLSEYQEPQVERPPSVGGLLFRIVVSLIVIILLSYGLIRAFGNRFKVSTGTWINVLDHIPLGPNRGIYLTDIGGKVLVLGVTDHSMVKLMEIEDEALIAEMRSFPGFVDASMDRKWWRGISRIRNNPIASKRDDYPKSRPGQQSNFHSIIEEQLRRMRGMSKDDSHE